MAAPAAAVAAVSGTSCAPTGYHTLVTVCLAFDFGILMLEAPCFADTGSRLHGYGFISLVCANSVANRYTGIDRRPSILSLQWSLS